ncbi:MAG: hypothetical protein ABIM40_01795 [Pseudomonadota bacterium]
MAASLVAVLTILMTSLIILLLQQSGMIAFIGGGFFVSSLNTLFQYLGYSVPFFVLVMAGFVYFLIRVKRVLANWEEPGDTGWEAPGKEWEEKEQLHIRQWGDLVHYLNGTDICITLFFAIGVLFTAWGMQNALVSAIGGMSQEQAAAIGAWGILQRLVDNGILIALWTTIVGGAGGYLMRTVRYFMVGREMEQRQLEAEKQESRKIHQGLEAIRAQVEALSAAPDGRGRV